MIVDWFCRIKILGRVPGTQFYEPLDDEEEEGYPGEEIPGVLIVRIRDIALTFGISPFFPYFDHSILTPGCAYLQLMPER